MQVGMTVLGSNQAAGSISVVLLNTFPYSRWTSKATSQSPASRLLVAGLPLLAAVLLQSGMLHHF